MTTVNILRPAPTPKPPMTSIDAATVEKLQRRRAFTRDRQTRYAARLKSERAPNVQQIGAALVAAVALTKRPARLKDAEVLQDALTILEGAGFSIRTVPAKLKQIRARLSPAPSGRTRQGRSSTGISARP